MAEAIRYQDALTAAHCCKPQSVFEQIFVEHGKQFVRFSPDGFETRPLNDFWPYGNRDGLP